MAASDYNRMCALDNLRRAYRWIQSNPDALYKSFFRDAYTAYAASSDYNLIRLRKHLLRYAYEPTHGSKIFFPKPSGILRPYTLLSVDDQIVYQACINVVAERLKPNIKNRYFKNIFGHIYAGKSSDFFYIKWQKGYRAYSKTVIDISNDGYNFVADFDLMSFYDSIDHAVIEYFLKDIDIDSELTDFLLNCLKIWTSNTWTNVSNVIYHGHGIPQGPLASGLLSEVVLKHIDDRGTRGRKRTIKYLRYVDDIKLFAKDKKPLRQRLVSLDLASREIGLFPQGAKISLREIGNPYDEIKSISGLDELVYAPGKNQERIRNELLSLYSRGEVKKENITRFKYLLARVEPNYRLNKALIGVLGNQPFLAINIASYFGRYKKLPRKSAEALVHFVVNEDIYHAVQASILFAIINNMVEPYKSFLLGYCYERLLGTKDNPPQPTFKSALIAWVLYNNRLTYAEMHKLLSEEMDWWIVKDALKYLQVDQYGQASYEEFLNILMRTTIGNDVARLAALKIVDDKLEPRPPIREASEAARLLLYAAGKIRHIGKPESLVGRTLCYVLKQTFPSYNWAKLCGPSHRDAEYIAFTIKRYYESDINSCIVTLDSLCDLIFEKLFEKHLPGKNYGNYGGMLKNPTLKGKLPQTCNAFEQLHRLRLQSITAHPRESRTGKPTRRLKHHDFYKIRPLLQSAFSEIINTVN